NRNTFFDLEQSVYDLAIDFEYSRRTNAQKAFEYSEGSRSRSLLDSMSTHTHLSAANGNVDITFERVAEPLTLSEIQRRMPQQAQIIQYAVLSNKLLIWVISKTEFWSVEKKVTQNQLSEKVISYVEILSSVNERNGDEVKHHAAELFDILIRPVEKLLQKNRALYVIPDKVLNYLPFGALVSPDSGNFML